MRKGRNLTAIFLAVATLATVFTMVGCKHPTGSSGSVDKTSLLKAIDDANAAMTGVQVATSASEVLPSTKWVTKEVWDAFVEAVEAAEAVANDEKVSTAKVNAALSDLNAATAAFNAAKNAGTKQPTGPAEADKTALNAAIVTANAAKTGVLISADGSNISTQDKWVTKAVMDALDAAITEAGAVAADSEADQAAVDAAATVLKAAEAAFNAAIKDGTNAEIVSVNRDALSAAIGAATAAKTGVVISVAGSDISEQTQWVAQTAWDAFEAAIEAANTVNTDASADQAAVDAAASTLGSATDVFNSAKKSGTYVNKTLLNNALTDAASAKNGVAVDTSPSNVPVGTQWVTAAELAALNTAIEAAQSVAGTATTQSVVDSAVQPLTAAIAAFNAAKKDGTQVIPVPVVSVTVAGPEVGKDATYDYQCALADFPAGGVQLTATPLPANADDKSIAWSIAEGGTGTGTVADGLVKITEAGTVTVRATAVNGVYGEFKFNVTAVTQPAESVEISGPSTVMATKTITLTASVHPAIVSDEVTWSIEPAAPSVATISADGVLTGAGEGTVSVYATSPNGAGGTAVKSPAYTVTVTKYLRYLHWTFQANPTGWTAGNNSGSLAADYDYDGLLLLSGTGSTDTSKDTGTGRSMGVYPASAIPSAGTPAESNFSGGRLRVNGKGTFAKISGVAGPFKITINYGSPSDDATGRFPSLKIDAAEINKSGNLSKVTEQNKGGVLTYSYEGTDTPVILIKAETNGQDIYDVIIQDLPPINQPITLVVFDDAGQGAFSKDAFTVYKSGATQTINLTGTWTSQQWYGDGVFKGAANSLTINAANYMIGGHTVTVEVKNGDIIPWSKTLTFTVAAEQPEGDK